MANFINNHACDQCDKMTRLFVKLGTNVCTNTKYTIQKIAQRLLNFAKLAKFRANLVTLLVI